MKIAVIDGATRVVGESQGYLGLPLRDEVVDDPVNGPGTPRMVTAWELEPDELARLNAGAQILLSILGTTPPPLLMEVAETTTDEPAWSWDDYEREFGQPPKTDGAAAPAEAAGDGEYVDPPSDQQPKEEP